MWNISVCAACLATEVRMFDLSATNLLVPYQLLSGIQFQSGDGMPRKLCWECAALVHKFSVFRHKCERAYLLLQDIYNEHDEISEEEVQRIDREEHNLSSNLSSTSLDTFVPSAAFSESVKKKNKKLFKVHIPTELKVEVPIDVDDAKMEDVKVENKKEEIEPEDVIYIEDSPPHCEVNIEEEMNFEVDIEETTACSDLEVDTQVEKEEFATSVDLGFTVETFPVKDTPNFGSKLHNNMYKCKKCSHSTHNKIIANQHQRTHRTKLKKRRRIDLIDATVTSLTQKEMEERFREREHSKMFTNATYKCTICFLVYRTRTKLMSHLARHEESYGKYECDICKFRFTSKGTLKRHLNDEHNNKFQCNLCPYVCCSITQAYLHHLRHNTTCAVCSLTFDSKSLLRQHSRTHWKFECRECGQKCLTSRGLRAHMESQHLLKKCKYSCEECAMPLRSKQQMNLHYRSLHPDVVVTIPKPFVCETCGKAYKSEDLLRKHNFVHSGIKPYKCKICERTFTRYGSWKSHMYSHSDERAYVCDVCGKSFKTSTLLRDHRTLHNATRDFKCDRCPKAYTNRKNLWMHNKANHSDKLYCCDYCHRDFSFKRNLEEHLKKKRIHRMARALTYQCGMCTLEFATHEERLTHRQLSHKDDARTNRVRTSFIKQVPGPNSEMVHVKGKKFEYFIVPNSGNETSPMYKCKVCMKNFSKYVNLDAHQTTHSEERPFVCSVCNKGFKFKAALKRHGLVHTGERPYKCDMCEKSFSTNDWRQLHTRRVHFNEHIPYKPRVRAKRRAPREQQPAV